MTNVLFISHDSAPYGAPKSMVNIIDGLQNEVNFTVLLPYNGGIDVELENKGIEYFVSRYHWDVYNLSSFKDYLLFPIRLLRHYNSYFKTLRLVKKLHKVHHFDLIHSNSGVIRVGFFMSKVLKIPHIWHVREFQTKDYNLNILFGRKYLIKLFKSSTQIICVSKSVQKYFDLQSNSVIYNGVMPKQSEEIIFEKEDYFIFAGSLFPQKGIFDVLTAFVKFAQINKTTEFFICGTGNEENILKIKNLIAKAGLQDRIKLLGYRTDVLTLLKKAKATIISSHYEAFGRITAEAMLMGSPVIGNASEGTLEIIQNSDYGFLYQNQQELVNAMIFTSDQNNKCQIDQIIISAKHRANNLFTQEKLSEKILEVYNALVENQN